MKRTKLCILPKLNHCSGDIAKQWFIYYSFRDPRDNKMKRFKIYEGFADCPTAESKYKHADEMIARYSQLLRTGWNPFIDKTEEIYDDQLQYKTMADIYGRRRSGNTTIVFYASEFLKKIMGAVDNDGTLSTYRSKLRIFVSWLDAHGYSGNDVSTITNRVILEFFEWLINERKLSGNTVKKYKQILQAIFENLVADKKIRENPVHDIPRCTRINDHSPSPIQQFDIVKFKEQMVDKDAQLWLAVQFQYYCAIRPGRELRLLKIKNIDFARGLVTIQRSHAKKRVTRTMVIPEVFLTELREMRLHNFDKEFYVFGKTGEPGPRNLGKNNLRYRFNAVRESLNMPMDYKFYSWKHTGGVMASLAGIPDKHIQMQMGHDSIATTDKYLRKMRGFDSQQIKNDFPPI